MAKVSWKEQPEEHDYPAAQAFLSLLTSDAEAGRIVKALQAAPVIQQKAKDILRAARLPLLPIDDPAVSSDLDKVSKGKPLSPVLLVGGDLSTGRALQIADGYHRVCASYHTDEDTDVPCRIVPPVAAPAG